MCEMTLIALGQMGPIPKYGGGVNPPKLHFQWHMNGMAVGEIIGVITRSLISNDFCFLFCVGFFGGGRVGGVDFQICYKEHVFCNKKENAIQNKIRLETEYITMEKMLKLILKC